MKTTIRIEFKVRQPLPTFASESAELPELPAGRPASGKGAPTTGAAAPTAAKSASLPVARPPTRTDTPACPRPPRRFFHSSIFRRP